MPLPSLLQTLLPLLMPSGNPNNNFGPGGIQQVPPGQWNPRFDAEQPPAEIPDASDVESFLSRQDVNNARNSADREQEISGNSDISGEVNSIMEKNKTALGLGGPNAFYDINLVKPASGDAYKNSSFVGPPSSNNDEFLGVEPDGFRLYLIAPTRPGVSTALAAIGSATKATGDAIKKGTEGIGALSETVKEGGEKAQQIANSINDYMVKAGDNFDKDFAKYIESAYDKNPSGSSFYSIVLPMPKELADVHGHEVDNIMLGVLPRAVSMLGAGVGGLMNALPAKQAKRATSHSSLADLMSGVTGGATGMLAEAGAYAIDTAKARIGIGLNPNVETVYAAPQPRNFVFTFELMVKSSEESRLIKDFIQKVKQHSYPYSVLGIGGQNQLYLYPGEVYFEFSGKFRNNLFRSLRPCIITNLQVSYGAAAEQYQHFADGSPIAYTVTITLLENKLLDRNIFIDDAANADKSFANDEYRENTKFRDTFLGKDAHALFNDPVGTIGGAFNTPPSTPPQQ